ncbi:MULTISPECIES: IclR family transcriptional regulator [Achromobacter]|uniref:IclR family transcriptional regulator n=1 Tax=Achromobacter spanius TaxID=217203 RepID=A0ABY8GZQ8_9BURK|nr:MULTISPECIES: IclR family transcriptional regulator [Achromobacter]WAI86238.1 IclR family transcriptional regulator [Achromobacter spanius]WEX96317.1 IclR family transcriptional regulator [Achromobacter sp. SS2-2022]WFP09963.1 IclR family transcriptional regulator [Achromobacter spanius]
MSILDGVQRVLSLYADGAMELSFTDVAARLAMPKSTASRLLNQMQRYGMLDQDPASRRYRPGALLAQAVRAGMAATPLDEACRDVLARLSEDSGLTAYLSTLNQRETVVLQRLNGSNPVQVLSPPGSRRNASGTAMGRALLSRLSDTEFQALYGADPTQPLPMEGRDCPATVGDLARLVEQSRADRCGLAIDQAMPGIGAVAAAVRDPATGELRGLCLSFVSFQADAARVARLRETVLTQVAGLGRQLNDPYWLP